jgi:hypothetical protein
MRKRGEGRTLLGNETGRTVERCGNLKNNPYYVILTLMLATI